MNQKFVIESTHLLRGLGVTVVTRSEVISTDGQPMDNRRMDLVADAMKKRPKPDHFRQFVVKEPPSD